MNPDDAALIRLAQRGDREAFGRLMVKHQDRVFNAVYRMTGRYEDAADIVQDTFLKAFRAIGSFHEGAGLYTWLFRIAVNTVISKRRKDTVRKEKQKVSIGAGDEDSPANDPPSRNPGPERLAENAETGRRIEQAIAELDEEHRIVVMLKDLEGFDYHQIGQMLGCPDGTVKSRLHRARLQLRAALGDLI